MSAEQDEAAAFIRSLVGAWDCCATCAGGVLLRHDRVKHHLTLCRTTRFGCWATCSCGWKSRTFVGVEGAHLAFGEHLTESTTPPGHPTSPEAAS